MIYLAFLGPAGSPFKNLIYTTETRSKMYWCIFLTKYDILNII